MIIKKYINGSLGPVKRKEETMRKNKVLAATMAATLALGMLTACSANEPGSTNSAPKETKEAASEGGDTTTTDAAWPGAAVQFSVPAKAGGVTDIYTRYVQNALQTTVGGTYSTVNYDTPAVAYQTVVAATDPNTLLFQHSSLACNYVTGSLQFNPTTDYRVVGCVADMGAQAIIVAPDAPYNTWEEFIDYAKANPGEASVAISTNGTTHFIFGEVEQFYGVEFTLNECGSEADKLTNIAGGILDLANCSLNNAKQYEEAGQIKVLAILGDGSKTSYDGFDWPVITDVTWAAHMYVFANANISDADAQAINDALVAVAADAEYVSECEAMGGAPLAYSLEEAQADFDATVDTCKSVAEALGILGI